MTELRSELKAHAHSALLKISSPTTAYWELKRRNKNRNWMAIDKLHASPDLDIPEMIDEKNFGPGEYKITLYTADDKRVEGVQPHIFIIEDPKNPIATTTTNKNYPTQIEDAQDNVNNVIRDLTDQIKIKGLTKALNDVEGNEEKNKVMQQNIQKLERNLEIERKEKEQEKANTTKTLQDTFFTMQQDSIRNQKEMMHEMKETMQNAMKEKESAMSNFQSLFIEMQKMSHEQDRLRKEESEKNNEKILTLIKESSNHNKGNEWKELLPIVLTWLTNQQNKKSPVQVLFESPVFPIILDRFLKKEENAVDKMLPQLFTSMSSIQSSMMEKSNEVQMAAIKQVLEANTNVGSDPNIEKIRAITHMSQAIMPQVTDALGKVAMIVVNSKQQQNEPQQPQPQQRQQPQPQQPQQTYRDQYQQQMYQSQFVQGGGYQQQTDYQNFSEMTPEQEKEYYQRLEWERQKQNMMEVSSDPIYKRNPYTLPEQNQPEQKQEIQRENIPQEIPQEQTPPQNLETQELKMIKQYESHIESSDLEQTFQAVSSDKDLCNTILNSEEILNYIIHKSEQNPESKLVKLYYKLENINKGS